ncbi:MAG TPA: outer membrane lipoprotein carrier protein LolA [Bryobacteraceae bacterium]|jgi:outer membrane lipoprotein carrier protein|nr:outer membrane lipoprotein carrier protein LolA [Bryobacteraceae bacterium]
MGRFCLLLAAALALPAETPDTSRILKNIEDHYNHIQTLQVAFTERYTGQGRTTNEKGELFLRKPGKMRWQYSVPAGELYISDGKYLYGYHPRDNRAERSSMKEMDDMRGPLAFLLGRLNFADDFKEFHTMPDRGSPDVFITAIPKSGKLPYSEVQFLVSPDSVIHWLLVKEQDGSSLEFTFQGEKKNPPIPDSMFKFTPPPGTEYVDSAKP